MYLVNDRKSAHATLPTQQKSTLLPRVPTHAYADCEISGRQPTRLYKEFPRIHNAGHSKKNDAQLLLETWVDPTLQVDNQCQLDTGNIGKPISQKICNVASKWQIA